MGKDEDGGLVLGANDGNDVGRMVGKRVFGWRVGDRVVLGSGNGAKTVGERVSGKGWEGVGHIVGL